MSNQTFSQVEKPNDDENQKEKIEENQSEKNRFADEISFFAVEHFLRINSTQKTDVLFAERMRKTFGRTKMGRVENGRTNLLTIVEIS